MAWTFCAPRPDLVRGAELEGEQVAQITPNDPLYRAVPVESPPHRDGAAWDLRPSATDVMVAVLDTGVDLTHPDLRPNLLLDLGYDFLDGTPTTARRRIPRHRGRRASSAHSATTATG